MFSRAVVTFCAVALFTACPRVESADAGVTATAFCVEFSRSYGAFLTRCGALSSEEYLTADAQPCKLDPKRRFQQDRANQCLAELDTQPCSSTMSSTCFEAFVGTLAEGDSCFEAQCGPGLQCEVSTSCPGRCVALPVPAALGEPCDAQTYCAFGAVCGPDGTCLEFSRGDAGAYCDESLGLGCSVGLQCIGDGCAPIPRAGESCSFPRYCQGDSWCLPGLMVCSSPLPLNGECERNSDCIGSLFCGFQEGAPTGNCMQRVVRGGLCSVGGLQCVPELTCVLIPDSPEGLGQCVSPAARGEPCPLLGESGFCSPGLQCTATPAHPEGTCENQKTTGQRCGNWGECQGYCQADGGCSASCLSPPP